MPEVTLNYSDEASIPAELKAFKKADSNAVKVWVGDKVAEETNPGLAQNRDAILREKETAVTAKQQLETTIGNLSSELQSARETIAKSAGNPTVTAEDIALLEVVKPLNLKAEDLKKQIQNGPQAAAELAKMKTQLHVNSVAKALNWNETVLSDLLAKDDSKNIEFAFEDVTADGKTTKQVVVNVKDDKGAVSKHNVEDFMKSQASWTPYLPVLAEKKQGQKWVPQAPTNGQRTSGKDEGNPLQNHIASKNTAATSGVNPLLPNQPTKAAAGTT